MTQEPGWRWMWWVSAPVAGVDGHGPWGDGGVQPSRLETNHPLQHPSVFLDRRISTARARIPIGWERNLTNLGKKNTDGFGTIRSFQLLKEAGLQADVTCCLARSITRQPLICSSNLGIVIHCNVQDDIVDLMFVPSIQILWTNMTFEFHWMAGIYL